MYVSVCNTGGGTIGSGRVTIEFMATNPIPTMVPLSTHPINTPHLFFYFYIFQGWFHCLPTPYQYKSSCSACTDNRVWRGVKGCLLLIHPCHNITQYITRFPRFFDAGTHVLS